MSPTVFMALVEQGLKVFSAIYKRVYLGLKKEFQKVYRLNKIYLEEYATYQVGDEAKMITQADYAAGASVVPVSDPKMVVDAQRMARVDVLAQFKDDPMMNGRAIRKRFLEAANIENPEEVLEEKPAPNPEMIAKLAELELKKISAMADVMVKVSQAIKNMADADAKVQEPFIAWVETQMQGIKNEVDRIQGNQSAGAGSGAGTDAGAMGAMAPSPGNAGLP
jgi:chaperonin GroES